MAWSSALRSSSTRWSRNSTCASSIRRRASATLNHSARSISTNSRRAAARASSSSDCSPFGIDQAPRSRRAQSLSVEVRSELPARHERGDHAAADDSVGRRAQDAGQVGERDVPEVVCDRRRREDNAGQGRLSSHSRNLPAASRRSAPPRSCRSQTCWVGSASGTSTPPISATRRSVGNTDTSSG